MNINDVMENDFENGNVGVSRETFEEGVEHVSRPKINILKTPSLDKAIEEYLNHPFNKESDYDLAQGLRGIEAFLGNTNLAIIDLFGFVKYFSKKAKSKKVEVQNESDIHR